MSAAEALNAPTFNQKQTSGHQAEESKIKSTLFSGKDTQGRLLRNYLFHVSIQEVTSLAELTRGPSSQRKPRAIIVGRTHSGKLEIYKAKESGNTYLIGRTWPFAELTKLELVKEAGLTATIGKRYFWDLESGAKRAKFVKDLTELYYESFAMQLQIKPLEEIPSLAPGSRSSRAPQDPGSSTSPASFPREIPGRSAHRPQEQNDSRQLPQSVGSFGSPSSFGASPLRSGSSQSPKSFNSDISGGAKQSPNYTRSKLGPSTVSPRAFTSPLSQSFTSNVLDPLTANSSGVAPLENRHTAKSSLQNKSPGADMQHRMENMARAQVNESSQSRTTGIPGSEIVSDTVTRGALGPSFESLPANRLEQSPGLLKSQPTFKHLESRKEAKESSQRLSPLTQAPLRHDGHTHPRPELLLAEERRGSNSPRSSPSAGLRDSSPLRPRNLRIQTSHDVNVGTEDTPYTPQDSAILAKRWSGTFNQNPLAFRYEYKSPRRKNLHSRQDSGTSMGSRNENDFGQVSDFVDLSSVLNEVGWNSEMCAKELEQTLNDMIGGLREEKVDKFVTVGEKMQELEELTRSSILNGSSLDATLSYINLQLEAIGKKVSDIEGQGETNQVAAMNRKLLLKELESLLDTVRLPTQLIQYLSSVKFGLESLPELESSLTELQRAVEAAGISSGKKDTRGGMLAAEDQRDLIGKTSESFSARAVQYLTRVISDTLHSKNVNQNMKKGSGELLNKLYPYAGVILFIKETSSESFARLIKNFMDESGDLNKRSCSAMVDAYKRRVSQIIGDRAEFLTDPSIENSANSASALMSRARRVNSHATHASSQYTQSYSLPEGKQSLLASEMSGFVEAIAEYFSSEQELVSLVFHYSSDASENFPSYVKSHPLKDRMQAYSGRNPQDFHVVDSSRSRSRELKTVVSRLFPSVRDILGGLSNYIKSSCIIESMSLIAALEHSISKWSFTDQEFTKSTLTWFREDLIRNWRSFIDEQANRALQVEIILKTRIGIVPVVSQFVTYFEISERSLALLKFKTTATETRRLLDESHDQLYRSLTQVFEGFTHEPTSGPASSLTLGPNEDKELLNSHITKIENLDLIITCLSNVRGDAAEKIVAQARDRYKNDLQAYLNEVLHRPLGHALDFLAQVKSSKDPRRKQKPSAIRKAASDFESRELRKNVDLLKKRVKKHFTGEDDSNLRLFDKVWRALSAEYVSYHGQLCAIAHSHDMDSVVDVPKQELIEILR